MQNLSRIKTNETSWFFSSHFLPLLKWEPLFEVAKAVAKIALSLKPNHFKQI